MLKVRIADIIRTCFERNGLEPVVANLTGTDKLVAFLVMDESVERDNLIVRISNEICEKVNIFAGYSVSICASDPCKNIEDFPQDAMSVRRRCCKKAFSLARICRPT